MKKAIAGFLVLVFLAGVAYAAPAFTGTGQKFREDGPGSSNGQTFHVSNGGDTVLWVDGHYYQWDDSHECYVRFVVFPSGLIICYYLDFHQTMLGNTMWHISQPWRDGVYSPTTVLDRRGYTGPDQEPPPSQGGH